MKLRDGDRCANPGCRARERLHAHHIVFRAGGGRTVMENEVGVCDTCHALIHAGLLRVSGTPWDKLTWTPRSSGLRVDTRSSARRLSQVPHVTVESVYTDGPVSSTPGDRATGDRATSDRASQLDPEVAALLNDLAGALTRLGMSKPQAMRRVEHAHRELSRSGEAFGEAEILSRALSG